MDSEENGSFQKGVINEDDMTKMISMRFVDESICQVCWVSKLKIKNCSSCNNIICDECSEKLYKRHQENTTCPNCREKLVMKNLDRNFLKMLAYTKLRCIYYKRGCTKYPNREDYESHVKECNYREKPEIKTVNCEYCKIEYSFEEFQSHNNDKKACFKVVEGKLIQASGQIQILENTIKSGELAKEKIEKITAEFKEVESKLFKKERECITKENEIENAKKEISELKKKLLKYKEEINSLKVKTENTIKSKDNEYQALVKRHKEEIENEKNKHESSIEELNLKYKKEIKEHSDKISDITEEARNQILSRDNEISKLKVMNDELLKSQQQIKEDLGELQKAFKDQQNQFYDKEHHLEDLLAQALDQKDELLKSQDDLKRMTFYLKPDFGQTEFIAFISTIQYSIIKTRFLQVLESKTSGDNNLSYTINKVPDDTLLCVRRFSQFYKFNEGFLKKHPYFVLVRLPDKVLNIKTADDKRKDREYRLNLYVAYLNDHELVKKTEEYDKFINCSDFQEEYFATLSDYTEIPTKEYKKEETTLSVIKGKIISLTGYNTSKENESQTHLLKKRQHFTNIYKIYKELTEQLKTFHQDLEKKKLIYRSLLLGLVHTDLQARDRDYYLKTAESYKTNMSKVDCFVKCSSTLLDEVTEILLVCEGFLDLLTRWETFAKRLEKIESARQSSESGVGNYNKEDLNKEYLKAKEIDGKFKESITLEEERFVNRYPSNEGKTIIDRFLILLDYIHKEEAKIA